MANRPTQPLIYDRTLQDVLNKTTKGNYNTSDFNRIMEWETYIHDLLGEYGYYCSITTLPTIQIGDMVNITTKINILKNNLANIKDTFYVLQTTPEVPSTSDTNINYIKANNIEKIINDIELLIYNMISSFVYCGTIYLGE